MSAISFRIPLEPCKSEDDFNTKISSLCDALENLDAYSLKLDPNTNTLIAREKNRANQAQLKKEEIGQFCQDLIKMNILWVNKNTLNSLRHWKDLKIEGFDRIAEELVVDVDLMVRKRLRNQAPSMAAPPGLDDDMKEQESSPSSDDTPQEFFLISTKGVKIPFDRKLLEPITLLKTLMEYSENNTLNFSKAGVDPSLTSTEVLTQFQAYVNKEGVRTEGSLEPLYKFAHYVGSDALMKDILLSSMRSRERPLTPFLFDELISRGFDFSVKELRIIEEYLEHREAWQTLAVNLCQKLSPIDPTNKVQLEKLTKLYDKLSSVEDKAEIMIHIEALLNEIEKENPEITDPIAQLFLSQCFLHGINLERDLTRTFVYAKKSADQGNPLAQTFAGVYYNKGLGCVEKNKEKAILYFTPAAERGLARAQYLLGALYDGMHYPRLAFQWVQKAARQGYAAAEYQLGRYFESETGLEEYPEPLSDEERKRLAFQWVEKAAKKGVPAAQNALGAYYEMGSGVKKDLTKAFENFMMAANQGDRVGQFNLARFYELGLIIRKDPVEAFQWLKKAADQELASAQRKVGICYEQGDGIKKNYKLAFDYYKSAAEQGDAEAQYLLGLCFEFDRFKGVRYSEKYPDKPDLEAKEWYEKAVAQGHFGASIHLRDLQRGQEG